MTADELKRILAGMVAEIRGHFDATVERIEKRFDGTETDLRNHADTTVGDLRPHVDAAETHISETGAERTRSMDPAWQKLDDDLQRIIDHLDRIHDKLGREGADIREEMRRGFAETQAMLAFPPRS